MNQTDGMDVSGASFFHKTIDMSSIQLDDCHNLSISDLGYMDTSAEKDRRLRCRLVSEPISSYENIVAVDGNDDDNDKITHPIQ